MVMLSTIIYTILIIPVGCNANSDRQTWVELFYVRLLYVMWTHMT